MLLNKTQLDSKISFIKAYVQADNAASGSKFDANANISSKNVATLSAEIHKDINIQIRRSIVSKKISELFGEDLALEYNRQLNEHEIYAHDETSLLMPYCASITMYPLLLSGLKELGGESGAPTHLASFCGSFVNLMFAVSSQFAGAVAAVELLNYFDYFARKDYGDNYLETHENEIKNHLQHIIYALNQPAAARSYQAVFWNISVFDQYYFESLFKDFYFPSGDAPKWETVKKLQEYFLNWFNKEREKAILTFPVVTAALLSNNGSAKDNEFAEVLAKELSNGNSFFIYSSPNADSLASCCRLRNELSSNVFSHSSGAGGIATGSVNVISVNFNRLIQKNIDLKSQIEKIHKYQISHLKIIEEMISANMLPVYSAGFISLKKQFLTIGLNGIVEAAEYNGLVPSNNPNYINWISSNLKIIFDSNKEASKLYGVMFNTEFVPGENLGVKFSKWDKEDGLITQRDCYNSYFYPVEASDISIFDKIEMHGEKTVKYLDGGSALHLNLENYLTKNQFLNVINACIKNGCSYFCTNVKITICESCGYIDKTTKKSCVKCGSLNVSHATRIIGYLKKITSWSGARKIEEKKRHKH